MNRLFKLSIVLVLSAAMLLSSFSAFAATDDELTLDIRLMQEFYSQPYHNGDISNGTKILSTFYQRPTEYDPDSIEQLMLMNNMTWENNYLHTFTNYVTPYIPNPCFIGADVFLGGNLILSETQVSEIRLFMAGTPYMQIIVRLLLHSALLLPCAAQTILKSSAELPLPGSMSKQEFHPFVLTLPVLKAHLPSSVSDAAISI